MTTDPPSRTFSRVLATALLFLAAVCASPVLAASPAQPLVPSVGAMKDIPDAHEKPDPSVHYRIVFDVRTLADNSDDVSPALQAIGGLLNTYHAYGVAADHLEATAVFHGGSIVLVTRDRVYSSRTGSQRNPNIKLLGELARAGVKLVVCGQSALAQHYAPTDLIPSATVNLSATVTFLNLQTRGYVKIEE